MNGGGETDDLPLDGCVGPSSGTGRDCDVPHDAASKAMVQNPIVRFLMDISFIVSTPKTD